MVERVAQLVELAFEPGDVPLDPDQGFLDSPDRRCGRAAPTALAGDLVLDRLRRLASAAPAGDRVRAGSRCSCRDTRSMAVLDRPDPGRDSVDEDSGRARRRESCRRTAASISSSVSREAIVEVVGRLVENQEVGMLEQQQRQRQAATARRRRAPATGLKTSSSLKRKRPR